MTFSVISSKNTHAQTNILAEPVGLAGPDKDPDDDQGGHDEQGGAPDAQALGWRHLKALQHQNCNELEKAVIQFEREEAGGYESKFTGCNVTGRGWSSVLET